MPEKILEPHLSKIKDFLKQRLGFHYTVMREGELSRKLKLAAVEFGFHSINEFISRIVESPLNRAELERLASFLTIGETYFLREKEAFSFLKNEFIKDYIANTKDKKLSIWSAGCSSGEEVYSLAGLIRETIPDIENWQITIVGTDINPDSLKRAREGVYTKWSFRNTPFWFKERYIKKLDDNKYQVADELKKMVEFKIHNLADKYISFRDVNVVFCRNVLIYFSHDLIKQVTSRFYDSLAEGGVLVLSPVEVSLDICERFIRRYYLGRTFYVKDSKSSKPYIHNGIGYQLPGVGSEEYTEDSSKVSLDQEYERIWFLYEEGLYLRVENLIRQKSASPANLPHRYKLLLGNTYYKQNKLKEAEELLLATQSNKGCDTELCFLLAKVYIEQSRLADAIDVLQKLIAHDPEFVMAYYHLGLIYKSLHESKASRKYFLISQEKLSVLQSESIIPSSKGLAANELIKLVNFELEALYE